MRSILRFLGTIVIPLLALLLLSPSPIAAQVAGKKVALVIGNGDYTDMPELKNPVSDATDVAAVLKSLGFEVTGLYNANRRQIDKAITAFRQSLAQDRQSEGFFYYAGHGVQAKGANYLIPVGADISSEADLDDEAVGLQRILGNIEEAGNRVNIVVLDACRNNPLPAEARSAERGLAVVASAPPESIVLFSTAANETALDGEGRNSPFAKALLDHLADPGDIGTTIRAVTAEVKSLTNGKQTPFQYTSLDFPVSLGSTTQFIAPTPSITVVRHYGHLEVSVHAEGSLYLDGKAIGDIAAGAATTINNVEAGDHSIELRLLSGDSETQKIKVLEGKAAHVVFEGTTAPQAATALSQAGALSSDWYISEGRCNIDKDESIHFDDTQSTIWYVKPYSNRLSFECTVQPRSDRTHDFRVNIGSASSSNTWGKGSYLQCLLPWEGGESCIDLMDNGPKVKILGGKSYINDTSYTVRVDVEDGVVKFFLNGKYFFAYGDEHVQGYPSNYFGFFGFKGTVISSIKIRIIK
jgi:hypothetical protein